MRRAVARDAAGLLAVVAQRGEPAGRGPWMRTTDAVLREARGAKKGARTLVPVHAGLARAARLVGQAGSLRFPPNRGGFLYAASRAGAAVFS